MAAPFCVEWRLPHFAAKGQKQTRELRFSTRLRRPLAYKTDRIFSHRRWTKRPEVALFFIRAERRGHPGKHNQAPKQVLGVVTLHAICEARHVVVPEPSSHFVWTGPLPSRPCP